MNLSPLFKDTEDILLFGLYIITLTRSSACVMECLAYDLNKAAFHCAPAVPCFTRAFDD